MCKQGQTNSNSRRKVLTGPRIFQWSCYVLPRGLTNSNRWQTIPNGKLTITNRITNQGPNIMNLMTGTQNAPSAAPDRSLHRQSRILTWRGKIGPAALKIVVQRSWALGARSAGAAIPCCLETGATMKSKLLRTLPKRGYWFWDANIGPTLCQMAPREPAGCQAAMATNAKRFTRPS